MLIIVLSFVTYLIKGFVFGLIAIKNIFAKFIEFKITFLKYTKKELIIVLRKIIILESNQNNSLIWKVTG